MWCKNIWFGPKVRIFRESLLLHLELIRRKLADHAAVFHQLVEFGEVITSNSAAGCRNGSVGDALVHGVGSVGYYWSSTPNDLNDAYYLNFNSGGVYPAGYNNRYYAYAVRLVTGVE